MHRTRLLWFGLLIVIAWAAGVPAGAADTSGQAGATYVGMETCKGCHEDVLAAWNDTIHAKIAANPRTDAQKNMCEGCHGPGSIHAENPSKATIRSTEAKDWGSACLSCHERELQKYWRGSAHEGRGLDCVSCHNPHKGNDKLLIKPGRASETCYTCHLFRRAQTMRSGHMPMREGKMECTSCHNPHGAPGPTLLSQYSVNENCYTCHAEKRGPFLWEHAPVRESCTNCHNPHGSMYTAMLVKDSPRLCNMCHNAGRHPTTAYPATGPSTMRVWNKACANCHPSVHGTNHPSGPFFQR